MYLLHFIRKRSLRFNAAASAALVALALAACSGSGTVPNPSGANSVPNDVKRAAVAHPNGFTTLVAVNAGGGATGGFGADGGYSGGSTYVTSALIDTTGVLNAAPQAVYQSERYGNFTYKLGGLAPGSAYTVRLHFAEIFWNNAGARVFNVAINSAPVLSNFDIFAAARVKNKAIVESFNTTADGSGAVTIAFTTVRDNAKVSGIEIVRQNPLVGAPVAVNAGGSATTGFSTDDNYNGGATYATNNAIDTTGVSNPAPQAVYQSERFGNFTYTFSGLTPGVSYAVRLHFAEIYWHAVGQRIFNVAINGTPELSNFDIYATVGANKATAQTYTVPANQSGNIAIVFTTVRDNAKVSGIEIASASGATPPPFSSKIQHVVVIVQENRSFDDLFNGFPGADSVQSGINSAGSTVALQPVTLEDHHDPAHAHTTFVTAYDGGKNDRFDQEGFDFFATSAPNYQYAYVPQSESGPYVALASKYALGDRMFTSNSGPSYVSHQYLIAGQSANVSEVPSQQPWGCDAPAGTTTTVLNAQGQEQQGPFPCFDYQTLGDSMDQKASRGRTTRRRSARTVRSGRLMTRSDTSGTATIGRRT